jgi:hypothetical protein
MLLLCLLLLNGEGNLFSVSEDLCATVAKYRKIAKGELE